MSGITSVSAQIVSFSGGELKFKIVAVVDPPNGVDFSPSAAGAYEVDGQSDSGIDMPRVGTSETYESAEIDMSGVSSGADITCTVQYDAQYSDTESGVTPVS